MLFNMRKPHRYVGVVTAYFDNGILTHFESNENTDYDWVPFLDNMVTDMRSVYPDSGSDGIAAIADKYFVKSDVDLFRNAMKRAGIVCDRDLCTRCIDYDTVCAIIDVLGILVDDDE